MYIQDKFPQSDALVDPRVRVHMYIHCHWWWEILCGSYTSLSVNTFRFHLFCSRITISKIFSVYNLIKLSIWQTIVNTHNTMNLYKMSCPVLNLELSTVSFKDIKTNMLHRAANNRQPGRTALICLLVWPCSVVSLSILNVSALRVM